MMKEEFEKRIGLEITAYEYADIEPLYMNDPKNRDKDAFCKTWLKEGGIQWLFDRRQEKINVQKQRIAEQEKQIADMYSTIGDFEKKVSDRNRQITALENSLGKVRELVA
jgi:uncharacterized coiled-coil protein SlyX